MDKKQFEQKLDEVAEWEYPETPLDGIDRRAAKALYKNSGLTDKEIYNEYLKETYDGRDPEVAPNIKKLKCQPVNCDDCGAFCANGRKKEKKIYETQGIRHWREHCVTCGINKNPFTNEYNLPQSEAAGVWHRWLRGGSNPEKYKDKKSKVTTTMTGVVEIEDDYSIIRIYQENQRA
jgi:Pyruvate/2-oxoacid:ferredoxin oxidoreductase delta subunit